VKAVQVALFDDIEFAAGKQRVPANHTTTLSFEGKTVELDLNDLNYHALKEFVTPYIKAGHPVGDPIASPKDHPGGAWAFYKGMREWADSQGRSDEYRARGEAGDGYSYDNKLRSDYRAHLASLPVK
jgi:hypothetical protein